MASQTADNAPTPVDVVAALTDMINSGAKQMATFVRASQPLLDAYAGLLRSAATLPTTTRTSMTGAAGSCAPAPWPAASGCCDIPETSCPPRCVCELTLEGARGDTLAGTITVTNTRKTNQVFTLGAKPFHGPEGATTASPSLSSPSVSLAPGESATIAVKVQAGEAFAAGETYRADVTIAGLYEQCVCVTLRTRTRPHCDVSQGEIPTHIRAHRWYDHFQCEELCFEPVAVRPQPSTPGTFTTDTPVAQTMTPAAMVPQTATPAATVAQAATPAPTSAVAVGQAATSAQAAMQAVAVAPGKAVPVDRAVTAATKAPTDPPR